MGYNYLSIPKLQRCNRWSLGMDKCFHHTLNWACDYLSMLGLKLNRVRKRGRRREPCFRFVLYCFIGVTWCVSNLILADGFKIATERKWLSMQRSNHLGQEMFDKQFWSDERVMKNLLCLFEDKFIRSSFWDEKRKALLCVWCGCLYLSGIQTI